MSKIIIEASSHYIAETSIVSLLNSGFVANKARISYNLKGTYFYGEYNEYPLIIEGQINNYRLDIYVTSECRITPNTLVRILKSLKLKFDPKDILTDRLTNNLGQIKLEICKKKY